jgi:hypothetical protein
MVRKAAAKDLEQPGPTLVRASQASDGTPSFVKGFLDEILGKVRPPAQAIRKAVKLRCVGFHQLYVQGPSHSVNPQRLVPRL